ncbi:oxygenase MpaB family protein [Kineococcus radiotolerans]|uniref:ER-bound oxygenase mpaB/mpaB'/Rubber oxygenase catalytic domain-containing protein n=1 Tax=Kineococcus radiotolerans (strain ATCC BAA-149 / DSM 14245 / SRS30216) TaxID=266940 RepID=A6WGY0_KINRD|nr:oxygenase MpaB family protein [Kineococcus radiotolerans]ABS06069.1 conserved hypothetical protein [Kineococcus radiotolerans SRS30216 = ATCC BAA-149]
MNAPQSADARQTSTGSTRAQDAQDAQDTQDLRSGQHPDGLVTPQVLSPQRLAEVNEVYRRLALAEFATESRIGFHLAYLRTFASPRVAGLLSHTGQMQKEPRRRGTDTGLFMYELIHHGLGSEVGDEVVRRLNGMHHRFSIRNEDYVWILGTFVVLGVRTIRRFGWRELTVFEEQASIDWYRELAARMDLTDVPETFEEFDRWFSDYEQTQLRSSPAGRQLIAATLDTVFDPVPTPLRPLAVRAAAVLLEEPARSALGFAAPGPIVRTAVHALFRLRALRRRRQPTPPSWFKPGAATSVYPQGYGLNDLGPRTQ